MRLVLLAVLATLLATGAPGARAEAKRVQRTSGVARVVAQKGGGNQPTQPTKKKAPEVTTAKCEVIEFHASKTGTPSVDAKLAKHKKALSEPPLSAFDTFKVTGTQALVVEQGKTGTVKITAKIDILFKGLVKQNEKSRLQLELTIDDPTGTRLVRQVQTQDSGAPVITSGGDHQGGKIFFAVTCSL
jgi:hypothetical protein